MQTKKVKLLVLLFALLFIVGGGIAAALVLRGRYTVVLSDAQIILTPEDEAALLSPFGSLSRGLMCKDNLADADNECYIPQMKDITISITGSGKNAVLLLRNSQQAIDYWKANPLDNDFTGNALLGSKCYYDQANGEIVILHFKEAGPNTAGSSYQLFAESRYGAVRQTGKLGSYTNTEPEPGDALLLWNAFVNRARAYNAASPAENPLFPTFYYVCVGENNVDLTGASPEEFVPLAFSVHSSWKYDRYTFVLLDKNSNKAVGLTCDVSDGTGALAPGYMNDAAGMSEQEIAAFLRRFDGTPAAVSAETRRALTFAADGADLVRTFELAVQ